MDAAKSQCQNILAHLKDRGPITGLEALKLYGCIHLPRRILDLREAGHRITSTMIEVPGRRGEKPKRVAQYSLVKLSRKGRA